MTVPRTDPGWATLVAQPVVIGDINPGPAARLSSARTVLTVDKTGDDNTGTQAQAQGLLLSGNVQVTSGF